MAGDLLDFIPRAKAPVPGKPVAHNWARAAQALDEENLSGRSLDLESLAASLDSDFSGRRDTPDFGRSKDYADVGALQRSNAQLLAALAARRSRLREVELEADEEEARSNSRLECLEEEVREEGAQVEMLKRLLLRALADADAVEAAEIVAEQRSEEAATFRTELEERGAVLSALRGQLQERVAMASASAGDLQTEAALLERDVSADGVGELRAELAGARRELEAQQVRSDSITQRTELLEEEIAQLRAATSSTRGRPGASRVLQRQLEELGLGPATRACTAQQVALSSSSFSDCLSDDEDLVRLRAANGSLQRRSWRPYADSVSEAAFSDDAADLEAGAPPADSEWAGHSAVA